jgi:hypothetical protein
MVVFESRKDLPHISVGKKDKKGGEGRDAN